MALGILLFCALAFASQDIHGVSDSNLVKTVENLQEHINLLTNVVNRLEADNDALKTRVKVLEELQVGKAYEQFHNRAYNSLEVDAEDPKIIDMHIASDLKSSNNSNENESSKWNSYESQNTDEFFVDRKRLVNQPVPSNGVAFFAYLSRNEPTVGAHQTFVFDVDHTNIGGHYNHHTGIFTCPSHGVYVFSWSIYCNYGGFVYSELVVNSSPVSAKYVGALSVSNQLSSTDLAIIELNTGDAVYIRTSPNHGANGSVLSNPLYRSTFSGWKLF